MSATKNPINWVNCIFLISTPFIGVASVIALGVTGNYHWATWVLAISFLYLTGCAITAGYHRLFSHKTYQASWPVRLIFLLLGAASFQGSVLEWSTDHRNHHRYTDTDKDPYDIKKGFWFAHFGWMLRLDPKARDYSNVEDLMQDPLARFQHRFFVPLAILVGFILPALIASLWGDFWGGLLIAGVFRMALNHHFTFAINSVCHWFGEKTYSDRQSARDNWITALFTYGEGFHNFHHQFPLDYRNGYRFYHYDPAKWIIKSLSWLRLAKNLKTVNTHIILRYQVKLVEKQLSAKLNKMQDSLLAQLQETLSPVRDGLQRAMSRLEQLEREYSQLRQQRLTLVKGKMNEYRVRIKMYRQHMKAAQQELRGYLLMWSHLASNYA